MLMKTGNYIASQKKNLIDFLNLFNFIIIIIIRFLL